MQLPQQTDGLTWCLERFFKQSTSPQGATACQHSVADIIMNIKNVTLRQAYTQMVGKWLLQHDKKAKDAIKQTSTDHASLSKQLKWLENEKERQLSIYNKVLHKYNAAPEKAITEMEDALKKAKDLYSDFVTKADLNIIELKNKINLVEQQQLEMDSSIYYYFSEMDLKKLIDIKLEDKKTQERKKQTSIDYDDEGGIVAIGGTDIWNHLPTFMQKDGMKESLMEHGFCEVTNRNKATGKPTQYGYYTFNFKEKVDQQATNFTIAPRFHVYKGVESRFIIEVDNGFKKAVMDVESKAFASPDVMQNSLIGEGNYMVFSGTLTYKRISNSLMQQFKRCIEVKELGWQSNGFWAFIDRVYLPGTNELMPVDEWGVVTTDKTKDSFLLPASSAAYKELNKTGEDPFENDRPMEFKQSEIELEEWMQLMQKVYKDHAATGIAYVFACIFHDILFAIDNNFPHLYAYGERSSGKSKFVESLNAFFFHKRSFFNLNSGTNPAFFGYMSKFRNCFAGLNEFDISVIKDEWFQSIKGIYDGEARQRNSMITRGKQEIQRVHGGLALIGQFLVTADDNSIVSRSCITPFFETAKTEEDNANYTLLKDLEELGLNSLLIDVVKHRDYIKVNYKEMFNNNIKAWRSKSANNANFNARIMQNWNHLYTIMQCVQMAAKLPPTAINLVKFEKHCYTQAVHWCNFIRSSDTLSAFWQELQYIIERGLIKQGWDYKIENTTAVPIRNKDKDVEIVNLPLGTKVLFLRLNNIHKIYQENYRKRTGKEAMTMENLLHYFSGRPYYIGNQGKKRFELGNADGRQSMVTSAYAFNLNMLDVKLETFGYDEINKPENEEDTVPNESSHNGRSTFDETPF